MNFVRFPSLIVYAGLIVRVLFLIFLMLQDPYRFLAGTDSISFYIEALQITNSGRFLSWDIGWHSYVNMVAFLMQFIGTSIVWMCLFSIIAWLLTALMVLKISDYCGATGRMKTVVAAVITFAPTMFLTTFIPLREPFQLLGITLILYSIFLFSHKKYAAAIILTLCGATMAGSLHLAMLAAVIAMFFTPLIYNKFIESRSITAGQIIFVLLISILGYLFLLTIIEARNYAGSENLFDAAESFQRTGASVDARAQYKSDIAETSGFGALYFAVIGFFQYILEPMPWRISTLGDVVVFLDNMLRLSLIIFSIKYVREGRGAHRMSVMFFLCLYLFVEFIWSLGTINWGTAARHHVPATALLLAAACAASAGYRSGHLARGRSAAVASRTSRRNRASVRK